MGKFKELTQEADVTELPAGNTTVEPKFTRYMVGTYLDPITREWMLSYVHFDPVTKTIDKMQTERVAGNTEVMRERLSITQAKLGLFDLEDVLGQGELEKIY